MPVTAVDKDLDARTLTVTAHFAAPVERVWQVYADPAQLARVWGPPSHPATFTEHSLAPGGMVRYYMTGPEGERYHGGWRVLTVDAPREFTFEDFFADATGDPDPTLPVSTCVYTFEPDGEGTRATYATTYATVEALTQVLDMGMEEGATLAIGQIDELLAAG